MVSRFPWLFSVLWLLILVVMVSAGFWQLRRADEKKDINQRLGTDALHLPQSLEHWQQMKAFDRVHVSGNFNNVHFLLDNQIMDGQIGFFVYTTFKTSEGHWLLVNRGWHNQDQDDFTLSNEDFELTGLVAEWPRPGIKLGEQAIANEPIQHVTYLEKGRTINFLQQRLCKQNTEVECIILPLVLKLDPAIIGGFKRQWQLPRMTVEKHQAYAAQWFTMSLVLCLVYGLFIRKHYKTINNAS